VKSDPESDLLPGEWAVLGVIAQEPTHGFAVARALAPGGRLGRVWTMSRPRVYRAINDLTERGLIAPTGTEQGERGPTRTTYGVTPAGRRRIEDWLQTPVDHVRDMRSDLLLKLALLHDRGTPPGPLLDAQRARLVPVLENLEDAVGRASDFDAVVLRYRLESTRSAIRFIDEVASAHARQA
jgi:DNA-binding PadR family transcriptional regulator